MHNFLKNEITALIKIRKSFGINSGSSVRVVKASQDVYSAIIDDKVAMKIGGGHWEPGSEWQLQADGREYKVWVKHSAAAIQRDSTTEKGKTDK